ncbi:putative ribosomal RNA small subunit methyltransferase B [Hyella patelloides LEGE 07179]|uniref:16S rRNA (cytosine(967)-C(5))-methyltransferase n=1 Tax=Hyella patelloides LEGE 07179 TaxID=945734 RepID=A0A563VUB0_9CYAN|nr:16S rRNA (cytosine(967)-C(5))-methyltransferase [Hyella patelloides]VEP14998.1 putative ribosomal RNA small subunit methyltransferase B [Hyella patelloides LEGE 07179]
MEFTTENPRQLAFLALQEIDRHQTYTDVALDRILRKNSLETRDRSLVSQLVYGVIRTERSLDTLIDLLGKKKASQQPPKLRRIFHLGLYQLRYLTHVPSSAAVNTTVELSKVNGLSRLKGVVNGLLRNYIRQTANGDLLALPPELSTEGNTIIGKQDLSPEDINKMGVYYSFPNWIVKNWLQQLSVQETNKLLAWFNRPGKIELRVNILQTSVAEVKTALEDIGVQVSLIASLPQALRIESGAGDIRKLPGYDAGWWIVQDSSAQLVTHLLAPQPGETIIDACAAPGGKTTHIAELMGDRGEIWACDRSTKRLQKVAQNANRLKLNSINALAEDSRNLERFVNKCDRVLLDAPCSGLGTLHKRPDIRWRQTPEKVKELTILQKELLEQAATWVKPQGILVYATCTLNLQENEKVIQSFLESHPHWKIQSPSGVFWDTFDTDAGWLKIYPHQYNMDGFFMVKLARQY